VKRFEAGGIDKRESVKKKLAARKTSCVWDVPSRGNGKHGKRCTELCPESEGGGGRDRKLGFDLGGTVRERSSGDKRRCREDYPSFRSL